MQKIEITRRALELNLGKLTAFLAVAKSGSISRAAPTVFLSPSALSHLISGLEKSLSVKLFTRRSHGLDLTREGQILFDFVRRLSEDVESLATRLIGDDRREILSLRIGTHETLATHLWPRVILDVAAREGGLKVSLLSGRVDPLIEMLLRGDLHGAVTVEPRPDARLNITPLYSGRLCFYAGKSLKLKRRGLRLQDVKKIPIFTDTQAHVRQGRSLVQTLNELGFENTGQFEVSSFEAAINLAELGLGIALLPDRNADRAVDGGRLRALSIGGVSVSQLLNYRICLATRADRHRELDFLHPILEDIFRERFARF